VNQLARFLLPLCLLFTAAQGALAGPVAMIVNFHDHEDPNSVYPEQLRAEFSKKFPSLTMRYAEADDPVALAMKLDHLLAPDDTIEVFVFLSHGASNSFEIEKEFAEYPEDLPYLVLSSALMAKNGGLSIPIRAPAIGDDSVWRRPNEIAVRVFAGLRGHFSPNVVALFDSCNLLSTRRSFAEAQLKAMASALGIESGTLYANSTLGIVPLSYRLLSKFFSKPFWSTEDSFIRLVRLHIQAPAAGIALLSLIALIANPSEPIHDLEPLLGFATLGLGGYHGAYVFMNQGYRVTLANGIAIETKKFRFQKQLRLAMERAKCLAVLGAEGEK